MTCKQAVASGLVEEAVMDAVLARVGQLWHESLIEGWMTNSNAHLEGATPLHVLVLRGPQEVLDALDATQAGAYA